ncbi:MAG: single-stranded-DNA-specific exonuclease RecJ [Cyclobacteriaceae bacterium]
MEKRWVYARGGGDDNVAELSASLNINPSLAGILVQRGIHNFDEAKHFFRPSLEDLHDPFLMKDMDRAVDRLTEAIANEEKILIYGDYDVDGTTAVSLVYGFLRRYYDQLDYYIPDRYKEGYGISETGIRWAHDNGFSLVIALDCGIKAIDRMNQANELGVDVIICDHHLPGENLPAAYAVLDPKRVDCSYPFTELSGCGVGFKLMQGFCQQQTIDHMELFGFLDLLAVSIASDIVPIVDENRIMAYYGLKKLNDQPLPGLKAIMDNSGYRGELDISAVVFGIGPRINAMGRISHARGSIQLLLSRTEEEAKGFALKVEGKNVERRNYDASITKEALEMIESNEGDHTARSTVLYNKDWHKGVIGIVASRCIEKYYRPTIILTESNDKATGSARSVLGFNVYEAIAECAELLDQFGGHQYAAGLTMDIKNITAFQDKFERVVSERITDDQLVPQIEINQSIDFDMINQKFFNILKQMSPFGPQNMQPVFATHKVIATANTRVLKGEHLKLFLKQNGSNKVMEAIGFGLAAYYDMIAAGMSFSVAYTIEENNYRDRVSLQLNVKDIKFD